MSKFILTYKQIVWKRLPHFNIPFKGKSVCVYVLSTKVTVLGTKCDGTSSDDCIYLQKQAWF